MVTAYARTLHDTVGPDLVLRYEELLEEFSERLGPTHYVVMTVKKLSDLRFFFSRSVPILAMARCA